MFRGGVCVLAVATAALACLGCGGKGGLATAPVKGTVLYQGKALTQGSIQFVPAARPGRERSDRFRWNLHRLDPRR